ncbi:glucosylceramidase-like [Tropilaelaps mercedesae]|uniref:Glucosylceramidase n=1 Tax=Tropilaelaps mercedesae TaxID=418985 RepID=A0A1V9XHE5_9ACAR|nr:glucosylceramidase-like [Tropilaelaps mercedesae]
MVSRLLILALLVLVASCLCESDGHRELCYPKKFSYNFVVCVCNVTHCTDIGPTRPEEGHVVMYQSLLNRLRFHKSRIHFGGTGTADLTLQLGEKTVQKIIGFKGAFTDAAGVNWLNLPEGLRQRLLNSYYGPQGTGYSVGRIPMARCDFSTREYTYADKPDDVELGSFSLADEDFHYKIPMIKEAPKIKGEPGGPYYKTWAKYFVKFYQSYKENGVDIWGFTTQNEPASSYCPYTSQTMGLTPDLERDFTNSDLGPALFNITHGKIKLMALDDNRYVLPWWANGLYRDPEAARYVAGLAVHWYYDKHTSSDWDHAESYAFNILDDLRHAVPGWVDWNLFLDLQGGPNWAENFLDAPIIVYKENQAFHKQPMCYALAHFSKFLPLDQ